MRIVADKGVQSVEAFGWGDQTERVIKTLKNPRAKFYLVVTDVNGNQVSIQIEEPKGVKLRADPDTGVRTIDEIKIDVLAVEVELDDEPPFELAGKGKAVMQVVSDCNWDTLAAKVLTDSSEWNPVVVKGEPVISETLRDYLTTNHPDYMRTRRLGREDVPVLSDRFSPLITREHFQTDSKIRTLKTDYFYDQLRMRTIMETRDVDTGEIVQSREVTDEEARRATRG